MEWFLINVVSVLLLPVFVLMVLVSILGGRVDGIVKMVFDLVSTVLVTVIRGFFDILKLVIGLLKEVLKKSKDGPTRRSPQSPKPPQPTPRIDGDNRHAHGSSPKDIECPSHSQERRRLQRTSVIIKTDR